MVQSVENWARLQGRVTRVESHPHLQDYVVADVDVHDVVPVAGFANMFEWARGKNIQLTIPSSKATELSLQAGSTIRSEVRRAGPDSSFVNPASIEIA